MPDISTNLVPRGLEEDQAFFLKLTAIQTIIFALAVICLVFIPMVIAGEKALFGALATGGIYLAFRLANAGNRKFFYYKFRGFKARRTKYIKRIGEV